MAVWKNKKTWIELSNVEAVLEENLPAGDLRAAKRAAVRCSQLLRVLPQVVDTSRGQRLKALIAEARGNWKAVASHRHYEVAHIAFMRELANVELPLARRAILREFSPELLSRTYARLATALDHVGAEYEARAARQWARRWARESGGRSKRQS